METNLTELTNLGDKLPVSFSFLPDKHLKQRFWRVILFRWGSRILWAETWRQVLAFYFSSTSCRKSWSPQGGASGHIEKWKQKRRKLKLPGRSFLRRHLSEITTSVIKTPQFQMFATLWEETSCISLPSSFSLLYLVSPFIPFFPPSKKIVQVFFFLLLSSFHLWSQSSWVTPTGDGRTSVTQLQGEPKILIKPQNCKHC